MRPLGELEAEIMDRLWNWDRPATARELLDDLGTTRPIAYSTVRTVAGILVRKGLLRREMAGRAWRYAPTATRPQFTAALMREVLAGTPDPAGALASFVEQISATETAALRSALRDGPGGGGGGGGTG
ncbi:BlaI/MecI/CopY family transcriptional regulator [Streptomyces zingiberis]|uniref:BlaI/MecI/CopY family transcriptional regulator n=1 Tax=Streptomyces zingiberis TaxID=2053010 RepID=A0ABX1BYX7_9ACTN|nr:BlaI/MecI/CopY family transcriptional regulator [Streptomyces zingiberis]NJQ01691.1 BlaI/MecI/CopY family transcriptional regulator [Streptomyces zingiberis]